MMDGRSRYLIGIIILVVVVVSALILASAAMQYNRRAGWFDAHEPPTESRCPALPAIVGHENIPQRQ